MWARHTFPTPKRFIAALSFQLDQSDFRILDIIQYLFDFPDILKKSFLALGRSSTYLSKLNSGGKQAHQIVMVEKEKKEKDKWGSNQEVVIP